MMGFVVVFSLPLILLAILLGFGCYFLGKAKGREEMYAEVRSQVYSTPVPPSAAMVSTPPAHYQKEGFNNV